MKTKQLWLIAATVVFSFIGCKKGNITEKTSLDGASTVDQSLTTTGTAPVEAPVCGEYVQFNLVDYYPNAYYGTYGTVRIGNDANNLYIVFNSLNGFDFTKLKLV